MQRRLAGSVEVGLQLVELESVTCCGAGDIHEADPDVVEEWKWDVPVWSCDGIICTGETYKSVVKMTFAKGASLKDPAGLFNSSLEGNTRRAIDIAEGGMLQNLLGTRRVKVNSLHGQGVDVLAPRARIEATCCEDGQVEAERERLRGTAERQPAAAHVWVGSSE